MYKRQVYTCYVVGPRRRLLGVVTVRSLLLARDSQLVSDVMEAVSYTHLWVLQPSRWFLA